jgi:hypothetical protein
MGLFLHNFPGIMGVLRENFLEDFQYFAASSLIFPIKE